jgi:hypothetical protein
MSEQPDEGHAREIETLLRLFDEFPDPLHLDVTPAVLTLIDLGLPGLAAALDRLNAPERLTRKRAQRVLDGVVAKHFGWISNVGYPTRDAERQARVVMEAQGYDLDAPESERLAAIERWRAWVAKEQQP